MIASTWLTENGQIAFKDLGPARKFFGQALSFSFFEWCQGLADAFSRGFLRTLGRCWGAWLDLPWMKQRQGEGGAVLSQFKRDVVTRWGGAVFCGEGQFIAAAAHVEVGVAPAMEFTGAAQGLSGTRGVRALASVVAEENRHQQKFGCSFPRAITTMFPSAIRRVVPASDS